MNMNGCVVEDFEGRWEHEDYQDLMCVTSMTGYAMTIVICTLNWVSNIQIEIALSTLETAYIALSQTMPDLLHLRRLIQ